MGVSFQRHAPAALYPQGKDPRYPLDRRVEWAPERVWTQGLEEKFPAPVGDRTPVVQPIVRHYTAAAMEMEFSWKLTVALLTKSIEQSHS
jgi:hypothetical protein